MTDPVDLVLSRLERVKKNGSGWTARCPSHEDRVASLSVAVGDDGRVLICCFAGCQFEQIVAALEIEQRDLFARDGCEPARRPASPPEPLPTAEQIATWQTAIRSECVLARLHDLRGWVPKAVEVLGLGLDGDRVVFPIRDANGALVNVVKYRPNAATRNGSKSIALRGRPRDLFPAPESINEGDGWLFLFEGEADAIRALSLGIAAVGVPGTNGWKRSYAKRFKGRRVAVCLDSDGAGRAAAAKVANSLHGVAAAVSVIDLDPTRDDGEDLTDFAAAARSEEDRHAARSVLLSIADKVYERSQRATAKATGTSLATVNRGVANATARGDESSPSAEPGEPGVANATPRLRFARADEFVAVEETASEALASDGADGAVIPASGFVLVYGDGGAGKTTLVNDLVVHLAAGQNWLGLVEPVRPLRVCVIENEGPRPMFRDKLRRKFACSWQDTAAGVFVLEEPWLSFDFRDERQRDDLVAFVDREQIDLVVAAPVARIGMEGGGTLDEIGAFVALLSDVQRRAVRPLTVLLVHHQNRAGQVSGAWEGLPDSLIHVQAQGHGRTRVLWQKLRWSSRLHGTTTSLLWAECDSFSVEEREQVTEDSMAAAIVAAATELPGGSWTKIRVKVRGNTDDAAKVRDRLLASGALVNTATREGYFSLWVADDPAATRSELRTGVERLPFASPQGGAPSEPFLRSTVLKERGTERNDPTGDDNPDTDVGREGEP
ncbi:MAG TPA: AAA family ATPase [Gaiellaceae bacterium]|nr:AAA family ATPase [Gaiellaceae bacterium]